MNPLLNAKDCTLYNSDFSTIINAQFSQQDDDSMTLILSTCPDASFPTSFRLVPDDNNKHGGVSYSCTTPSAFSAYHEYSTGRTYYICEISAHEIPNIRDDVRVNVELEVSACFGASEVPEPITIENISAGGLMFISKHHYSKYIALQFSLEAGKTHLPLTARVLSIRPSSKNGFYAYGCQFTNLSAHDESILRQFIFVQELRSRR